MQTEYNLLAVEGPVVSLAVDVVEFAITSAAIRHRLKVL
jgi:hypothetical protein